MPNPTSPNEVVVAPACCPACGSTDLQTTSKTIDVSTYWRCNACGEVWNVSRREQGSHNGFPRR